MSKLYPFKTYYTEKRWLTYYYQIELILASNSKKILVIGDADGLMTTALKHIRPNFKIDTFDIREGFTYQGDVKEISNIVKKKYDCIVCCQVLEHIEYKFFKSILEQFKIIADKVVISVPIFNGKQCQYHKWEVNDGVVLLKDVEDIFQETYNECNKQIKLKRFLFLTNFTYDD